MSQFEVFEPGNTLVFTWQASIAPDAAPTFKVTQVNCLGAIIASLTAQQSDSTHYWAPFTMPTSEGYYRGEWFALKTTAGSARQSVHRTGWLVHTTVIPTAGP